MPLTPPRSLSPSKVSAFRDCALAFRFTAVERLPDLPTIWTVKGTLVHTAMERLFWRHPQGRRTKVAALGELSTARRELEDDPDFCSLELSDAATETLYDDARTLVGNYFELEDPNAVSPVGVELSLEARIGDVRLRGIIDRLDRTPDGDLVIVDYKTGRAPAPAHESSKLLGVHLYALLCQEVLGRRPVAVRLLHLKEPTTITAEPTEQALRGHRTKTLAVWSAIERACREEDFRPRVSPLCNFCRFREFCPAHGGDPTLAATSLAVGAASAG